MSWHVLQVELRPADALVTTMVSEAHPDEASARAQVRGYLREITRQRPTAAPGIVSRWDARPESVTLGPFTWAVIEAPEGDWQAAAQAWVESYAQLVREAGDGLDVQVAAPRRG